VPISVAPPKPQMGMAYGFDNAGWIAQLREHQKAIRSLGLAVGNFLSAAFPHARSEARGVGQAIADFMDCGTDKQIDLLEHPPEMSYGPVYPPANAQMLKILVEERNMLEEQIEELEKAKQAMLDDGVGEGVVSMLNASVGMIGHRQRLDLLNEQIERVQKELESAGDLQRQVDGAECTPEANK
jgi:hypothetical protein